MVPFLWVYCFFYMGRLCWIIRWFCCVFFGIICRDQVFKEWCVTARADAHVAPSGLHHQTGFYRVATPSTPDTELPPVGILQNSHHIRYRSWFLRNLWLFSSDINPTVASEVTLHAAYSALPGIININSANRRMLLTAVKDTDVKSVWSVLTEVPPTEGSVEEDRG